MKWEPRECRAGDIVRIRLGALYHFGIFVSEDEVIQFGLPPTAENRAAEGEEIRVLATDIDAFACGCIVEAACLDKAERRRANPPEKTIALARSRLGEGGYNIIHNNCEHFVNECVFGESRCTQEEEMRRRWANRPICDVYLMRIPAAAVTEGIYPDRRRAEIEGIQDENARRDAAAAWQLLSLAAQRSFQTDLPNAGFKRKLGGKWVCERFRFATAAGDGVVAVAVSNGAVSLQTGDGRTLRHPRFSVSLTGEHAASANWFWAEDGKVRMLSEQEFMEK